MVGLFLAEWLLVSSSACRNAPGWGCVGVVVWWGDATPFVLLIVGWPVLRMLGVRPAWLTALLGAGLSWYLLRHLTAAASLPVLPGGINWVQFALPTAAFALAAWLTASLRPWLPRVALVVALALVVPVNTFAVSKVNDSRQNAALSATSVPLLGPQVPSGYHIEGVGTEALTAPTFYYRLAPDGQDATTMAELQREIQVFVAPVQPQFTPLRTAPRSTPAIPSQPPPVPPLRRTCGVRGTRSTSPTTSGLATRWRTSRRPRRR
ncbi:hypothetical protein [Streptomyces lasalocidi]|uniref:Uncharacterized protein n=1 Tax=Streptomyces lasalocidi TaxID=324833 RepID=A0A4U5W6Q4_STRLS|nr:hypothetical protein [Streptomyces lasalocidi]TKS96300.1 hypothetical protein E4U91_37060 [Streptomyces lasalocidi]